ncbi:unnamed protein product [Pseudo-nitzschia multistriata]|uniref:Cupin type-2 domain-containing protein n=1 Tax=Pseudo-nitzschia multistriata TaxID=183589 RepID=A0A448ZTM8_9STRA|nr:unnamed protein product [Pseudo-nitzschia multistriata]
MTTINSLGHARGVLNQQRRPQKKNGYLPVLVAFLLGIVAGRFGSPATDRKVPAPPGASARGNAGGIGNPPPRTSVRRLEDTPFRATSHADRATGTTIAKQQFLDPFVVPNLAGVSVATLRANQTVEPHSHRSMHEFFYVLEGTADFALCGRETHRAKGGTFVHVVPGCVHSIARVQGTGGDGDDGDLRVLVVGVTVGD